MIKVENIDVWGIKHAIRGMRNPMNSWAASDSDFDHDLFGKTDAELAQRLIHAGTEHRKFLRQIFISMDITAPLYWWKEFDTYKVGTAANSCSTMHKIAAKTFTPDDFSTEHLSDVNREIFSIYLETLNLEREEYLATKNKDVWWQMIQLLPASYNQRRTVTMNYENAMNMIHQRTGHKLDEWNQFVHILSGLPYMKIFLRGAE